jgi:hypothetical protein
LEVRVDKIVEPESLDLGDIVVLNCDDEIYVTLVTLIPGKELSFCLVGLNKGNVWSSAKTLEKLYEDTRDRYPFEKYSFTIYKSSKYLLQLTKK